MDVRKGEADISTESQVRSSRFVETDEGWYFRTREGIAVGPYPSKFDAEVCASLLVSRLSQLERQQDMTHTIQEFLCDPNAGPRSAQFRQPQQVEWDKILERKRSREKEFARNLQVGLQGLWLKTRTAISEMGARGR